MKLNIFEKQIHKKEQVDVLITFTILTLIWTGYWIGNMILQTTLIKHLGIEILPYTYILSVIVPVLLTGVYVKIVKNMDNNAILFILFLIMAIVLFFSAFLIITDNQALWRFNLFMFVIVSANAISMTLLIPISWNLITKIFRPLQLRRLLPIFSLAPIIAGIASGLLVHLVLTLFGNKYLVFSWVVLIVLSGVLIFNYYIKSFYAMKFVKIDRSSESPDENPFQEIKFLSTNYISIILVLISLFNMITFTLSSYQLVSVVNSTYPTEEGVAAFFSNMQIAVYTSIIVFLFAFKDKLLSSLGVINSLIILPILMFLGFSLILFHYGFIELFLFRSIANFVTYAIFASTYQIAFVALPKNHQKTARTVSLALSYLGLGFSGVLLIFLSDQILLISIIGLIFSAAWVYISFIGKKKYSSALLDNLSKKESLSETLESLEDKYDLNINNKLREILLDERNRHSEYEKIKILETVIRLENINLLRSVLILVAHENYEIRVAAIKVLKHIFPRVSKNYFASDYIKTLMINVLQTDSIDLVRAQAANFLVLYSSKTEMSEWLSIIFKQENNVEIKLATFKALKNLNLEFVDFLLLKGLEDKEPQIQGKIAAILNKYPEYEKISKNIILGLLKSKDVNSNIAGLKAAVLIEPNEVGFHENIECFLNHENVSIKMLASLIYLRQSVDSPQRDVFLEEFLDFLANSQNFTEKNWNDFALLLTEIGDDSLMDELLFGLQDKVSCNPLAKVDLKNLIEFMYRKIDDIDEL